MIDCNHKKKRKQKNITILVTVKYDIVFKLFVVFKCKRFVCLKKYIQKKQKTKETKNNDRIKQHMVYVVSFCMFVACVCVL